MEHARRIEHADRERVRREAANHVFARPGQARANQGNAGRRVARRDNPRSCGLPVTSAPPEVAGVELQAPPVMAPSIETIPQVVEREIDMYKEVPLFVKDKPDWWMQWRYYFTFEILMCLLGVWMWQDGFPVIALFTAISGCLAIQPIKQVVILVVKSEYFTFKGVVVNVFPFSLMFTPSVRTNPLHIKVLGRNSIQVQVNQRMLNDLHRDGRMCDYSKGDVFARCSSIIAKTHLKVSYTSPEGEPLSEEEVTSVSSDAIAYFLQSLVIARTHTSRGAVTKDSFKELLSN
jgi:hypothetical protein